jgi:plasmid stabilization system protein ParE
LKKFKVVWTEEAAESLDFFCEYIHERSPSAAKKVKKEIIQTAKRLSVYPEMFQIDEFLMSQLKISEGSFGGAIR